MASICCLQLEVKGFVQAREYMGVGDPTQESLQYVLESTAATGSCTHGLPYLPTGNLVSGLPAALMSCCQARPPFNHSVRLLHSFWHYVVAMEAGMCAGQRSLKCSGRLSCCSKPEDVGLHPSTEPGFHIAQLMASFLAAGAAEGCNTAAFGGCLAHARLLLHTGHSTSPDKAPQLSRWASLSTLFLTALQLTDLMSC